jgi:drug/metabolite transporter (DMT)-like permease
MYPFLMALFSAALFGLSTPLSKGLLAFWTPQQLAGMLYLGAACGVALPLLVSRAGFLPGRIGRANVLRLAGTILAGGVLGPLCLLAGLRLASAASVSLWLNLEMAATSLLAVILFREHLGPKGWAGAACILGAGALLSWGGGAAGLKAGSLVGLACLCWGLDNNLTSLIDGLHPMQSAFWKGLAAGVVNLSAGLWLSRPDRIPPGAVAGALGLGALSFGISLVLYIQAAQDLGASRSQMAFASSPLFGLAFSWFWLREPATAFQGLALALQAAGTILLFRDRHAHPHTHEAMEHTHMHRHDDGHHNHGHEGLPASHRHAHRHRHEILTHDHPHWPDLHHRHPH